MMQGQPGRALLALHHSSFGGGEAWRATEGKSSGEEKAIHGKTLLQQECGSAVSSF
jgi:hypothetical protein